MTPDERYRTRPIGPWRGLGVHPGQPLPNVDHVVYVVGCRARQRISVLGSEARYCTESRANRLDLYGQAWALDYVNKTGGPDAWRYRAPHVWQQILNARHAHANIEEVEHPV
jgi:hypothetical protein